MTCPPIDRGQAEQFIALLGKTPATARLRAFAHKKNPRKWHPKTCPDGIRGRSGGFNLTTAHRWQNEERGVYLVTGHGGHKDEDITSCPALFAEWDDRPVAEQLVAWQRFGLPEPSITILTGGKSAHLYWLLAEPLPPDEWRPLQAALIDLTGCDTTLRNPSRVMRLPGAFYIGADGQPTGQTTIHSAPGHLYTLEQVLSWFPAQSAEPSPTAADAPQGIPLDDDTSWAHPTNLDGTFPPRPLEQIREALAHIPPRVAGTNTYPTYRNVLWGLIRACEEAGCDRETAIALMEAHSPDGWDVRQVASSGGDHIAAATFWHHARQNGWRPAAEAPAGNDPTPGSTPAGGDQQGQQGQQGAPGRGQGSQERKGGQGQPGADGARPSLPQQIGTLLDHLLTLQLDARDTTNEQLAAHADLWALGVPTAAIHDRLYYQLAAAWGLPLQQGHSGARRGRTLADPQDNPAEDLLPGFLLWRRDHVLFGPGGAGKTLAAAAMAVSIITGAPFLDQETPPPRTGRVLWVGTDGGEGARAMVSEYLEDIGAADDPRVVDGLTIWTAEAADGMPAWCCSPRGLLELRDELDGGDYALVIIDSLKSVFELAGINVGIGPVGTVMRFLQALVGRHCSLLWLHHPAGGKASGRGVASAAGSQNINQIPSAVHQISRVSHNGQPVNQWDVHKLRGSPSREFKYRLAESGLEVCDGEVIGNAKSQILDAISVLQASDKVASSSEIVNQLFGVGEKTVRNNLVTLRRGRYIQKRGRGIGWHLTERGINALTLVGGGHDPWA
jgi:hypothetical protein